MRQLFLKASFDLGWGSSGYRLALGGQGDTALFVTFGPDAPKVVVPLAGTFSALTIYSPLGTHPNYTVTLLVNGVASALACGLTAAQDQATDRTHTVAVGAGDDVCFAVDVSPAGSGVGYPLALSVEFAGAQHWFGVAPMSGSFAVGNTQTAGALGNGIFQALSPPTTLSATRSICTTPGTLTGLRLKAFSGAPGVGVWTAVVTKNQIVQNGTGGTVNTACPLTGAATQAATTFTLPLAVGDHVDLAVLRTGLDAPFAVAQVAVSTTFTPTDPTAFMACGGSDDANAETAVDWKWVQSQQLSPAEARAQCPVGPGGFVVTGLYVEAPTAPGLGRRRTVMVRNTGTDTPATVTIADFVTSGVVTGLAVPFRDGDLLDLQITPEGTPAVGNGLWWGLALAPLPAPPPSTHTKIRRLRRAPHLSAEQVTQFFARFQLDLEAGVGNAADPGADPQVFLRWSDDGGHTWRGPLAVSAGTVGQFRRRAIWRRLGRSRDRVFEVSMSDPVKWALLAASLDAGKGTS